MRSEPYAPIAGQHSTSLLTGFCLKASTVASIRCFRSMGLSIRTSKPTIDSIGREKYVMHDLWASHMVRHFLLFSALASSILLYSAPPAGAGEPPPVRIVSLTVAPTRF